MNTKSRAANQKVVPGSWHGTRSRHNLILQMARDAEKLAAQADRLKELKRQARGTTFSNIADATGATERQVQRWFAGDSDIGAENLKRLARYLGTTPDYIEYGREKTSTPDLSNGESQLDRIERKLDEIRAFMDELSVEGIQAAVQQALPRESSRRVAAGRSRRAVQ